MWGGLTEVTCDRAITARAPSRIEILRLTQDRQRSGQALGTRCGAAVENRVTRFRGRGLRFDATTRVGNPARNQIRPPEIWFRHNVSLSHSVRE